MDAMEERLSPLRLPQRASAREWAASAAASVSDFPEELSSSALGR